MTEVKLTTILLMAGALLLCLTFAWFFFFLPLGCVMNPTGCKEQFPVFGPIGLPPMATARGRVPPHHCGTSPLKLGVRA